MLPLLSAIVNLAQSLDTTQVLITVCALLAAYFVKVFLKRRNFPPGPWGWPIVGYLPYMSSDAHLDFIKIGKKYGDIFSLKLGSSTVVILNGPEVVKEALNRPEFLGRPKDGALPIFLPGSTFFVEDIHVWKEHRRYVVQSMKDLGLGRTKIEGDILEEIHHFLDLMNTHKGRPVDLNAPLSPSISNNICSLVFGKRYEYNDKDRMYLDSNLDLATETFSHTTFVGFFPWLLRVPFFSKMFSLEKGFNALQNVRNLLKKEINKHKDTFDAKNIRDFIDSFIVEMNSRKLKDPNTTLNDDSLTADVMDLFGAGSETVRNVILWCVYVAAAHPEVQQKIREEMLDVLGPDRDPEILDLRSAPRTHSFILEVMRWKTPVPLGVPKCTVADTTICGYSIPKNTTIITNLWNTHHSPEHWSEPEKFKPERFISKDGKTVSKSSYLMPFSIGKRVCPGETMAIMEIFLYFTSILRKFDLAFPEGFKPTYDAVLTAVFKLNAYKIRLVPRN
ncbi:hypothetical protein JTE90_000151 [Oedothorax gibbosus]|uniref:Cytochrome P450 n=1 Tax=Oedothorax gibbosus TaxID=931172 RepID=A0AAV6U507_9ARAC|nr:hypothetical protein JTE90_000151 [Oedothorax gibbosus]